MAPVPQHPKIYHIVHVDRLESIVQEGCLWSDAEARERDLTGTTIGLPWIKERRMRSQLASHPGLRVGECVPFYFCPRSVMLHYISVHRDDTGGLMYSGGQGPIVHMEADLKETAAWAEATGRRWAFTLSNAGSDYFEDRKDLGQLHEIDWDAVQARYWADKKEGKQAEFLVEQSFPFEQVSFIGVSSIEIRDRVRDIVEGAGHRPVVDVARNWYY